MSDVGERRRPRTDVPAIDPRLSPSLYRYRAVTLPTNNPADGLHTAIWEPPGCHHSLVNRIVPHSPDSPVSSVQNVDIPFRFARDGSWLPESRIHWRSAIACKRGRARSGTTAAKVL